MVGMDAKLLDKWLRLVGPRYQGVVAAIARRVMPPPVGQPPPEARERKVPDSR